MSSTFQTPGLLVVSGVGATVTLASPKPKIVRSVPVLVAFIASCRYADYSSDQHLMIYRHAQGVPPVTLAEFSLHQAGGADYYDVSLVDGYGLPVRISPSASACHVADCPVDLGPDCPDALKGPFDSNGYPLGCKSACYANLDGNQGA